MMLTLLSPPQATLKKGKWRAIWPSAQRFLPSHLRQPQPPIFLVARGDCEFSGRFPTGNVSDIC